MLCLTGLEVFNSIFHVKQENCKNVIERSGYGEYSDIIDNISTTLYTKEYESEYDGENKTRTYIIVSNFFLLQEKKIIE